MPSQSTFAGQGDAERLTIRYSSVLPEFEISAVAATENSIPSQAHGLGEVSVAATRQADQSKLDRLAGLPVLPPAQAEPSRANEAEQPQAGSVYEALAPFQQREVDLVMYLLGQPGFAVVSSNAGGQVRNDLEFSRTAWNRTRANLVERELILTEKAHPKSTRISAIKLDIEALKIQKNNHLALPEIRQRISEIEKVSSDEAPSSPGDADDAQAPPKPDAGGESSAYEHRLSPRVRRAMALDPSPKTGYKREPPQSSFLAQARIPTGGNRGQRQRGKPT